MQHHVEMTPKGEAYAAAHSLRPGGCPAGIDPQEWRDAISKRVDQHLSLVTVLLALLDGDSPDPDLEPDEDGEPSIGGNAMNFALVDCEIDDADSEPSLGWTDMEGRYGNRRMAPTFDPDREVDNADEEPTLGAPETEFAPPEYFSTKRLPVYAAVPLTSQASWARGRGDDEEQVNEDGDDLDTREGEHWEDAEPDLGWSIPSADTSQSYGYTCAGYGMGEGDGLEYGEGDDAEGDGPSWREALDQTMLEVR